MRYQLLNNSHLRSFEDDADCDQLSIRLMNRYMCPKGMLWNKKKTEMTAGSVATTAKDCDRYLKEATAESRELLKAALNVEDAAICASLFAVGWKNVSINPWASRARIPLIPVSIITDVFLITPLCFWQTLSVIRIHNPPTTALCYTGSFKTISRSVSSFPRVCLMSCCKPYLVDIVRDSLKELLIKSVPSAFSLMFWPTGSSCTEISSSQKAVSEPCFTLSRKAVVICLTFSTYFSFSCRSLRVCSFLTASPWTSPPWNLLRSFCNLSLFTNLCNSFQPL